MKKTILWSLLFFAPVVIFILLPAVYVYYVDPLWLWSHPFHMKGWHSGFDERQQKTNWLASRRPAIDTVLLGSSRTTYMDPRLFSPLGFNYGVSSGRPEEYEGFGRFVSQRSKLPVKTWILETGFDTAIETVSTFDSADEYIKRAESPEYRLNSLFSRDTYMRSKKITPVNESGDIPAGGIYYLCDKQGLSRSYRQEQTPTKEFFLSEVERQLKVYAQDVFDVKWRYKDNFQDILSRCITAFDGDGVTIIFYAPPTHWRMLTLMYHMGRFEDYRRWARDVTQIAGGFWNFNYPNALTLSDNNFKDSHHALPQTLELVAEQIKSQGAQGFEYGYYVTADNVEEFLNEVEKRLVKLESSSCRVCQK